MKVAINGLGRIGRAALKVLEGIEQLDLVAVNDIAPIHNLAYLIRYDSVYGRYQEAVEVDGDSLVVADRSIRHLACRDPADLPWRELGVELVFECTGIFTDFESARKHLNAGAAWVIISAPAKGDDVPTVVHGVNSAGASSRVVSCASCTTNSITPVVEVLGRRIGIAKAMLTTVHAYTSSQSLVDAPQRRKRRGRAAAANIIPASTGAAVATTRALPQYERKFDGVALRVPVTVGSISDITLLMVRATSPAEVNDVLREEAGSDRYREVLGVSDDPLVSTDIVQDGRAAIVDAEMTRVVDGDLVKVMAWYDNEWGYANQMIRQALELSASQS